MGEVINPEWSTKVKLKLTNVSKQVSPISMQISLKMPFGGIDEDMFVAAKLMTLGGNSNTSEKGVGNKEDDLYQWGEEKSADLMINIANVINSTTNSVVRFALPVAQSIAMMLIFMLLIIFILSWSI